MAISRKKDWPDLGPPGEKFASEPFGSYCEQVADVRQTTWPASDKSGVLAERWSELLPQSRSLRLPSAIQDMLGGVLPALCTPLGTFLSQPKLRVLATSGARRSRFTPNVPTLVEQGFKDMAYDEWYGFFLPAKAPADAVRRLNTALREALAERDIVETLATFGMEATPTTPEQLAAALRADLQRWGPIVKSIGFSADS